MNNSDVVSEVATRSGLKRTDAAGAADAVFEAVTEALARWEQVTIAWFGLFAARYVPPCTVRNWRTGEPVAVAASIVPTFNPAGALREAVNSEASS